MTEQELVMFMSLCKYQKLNPFLREAYLIKYGNEKATLVTGKETFTKRAAASPLCSGWEAGIIVKTKEGKIEQRVGTFFAADDETLLGGWATVHRKDWQVPMHQTVSLAEYRRLKSDGTPMAEWKNKPATMIRKVALVQALRDAMPEEFEGMYSPEEMPVDCSSLSEAEVKIDHDIETEANADIIDVDPEQGEQASLEIPEEPKKKNGKPKF